MKNGETLSFTQCSIEGFAPNARLAGRFFVPVGGQCRSDGRRPLPTNVCTPVLAEPFPVMRSRVCVDVIPPWMSPASSSWRTDGLLVIDRNLVEHTPGHAFAIRLSVRKVLRPASRSCSAYPFCVATARRRNGSPRTGAARLLGLRLAHVRWESAPARPRPRAERKVLHTQSVAIFQTLFITCQSASSTGILLILSIVRAWNPCRSSTLSTPEHVQTKLGKSSSLRTLRVEINKQCRLLFLIEFLAQRHFLLHDDCTIR